VQSYSACVVESRCQGDTSYSTRSAQNVFTYSWFWWLVSIQSVGNRCWKCWFANSNNIQYNSDIELYTVSTKKRPPKHA